MTYPTEKDRLRMLRLENFAARHGLTAALQKAERDAQRIETLAKCRARAQLLEDRGLFRLADPFKARQQWLVAQGVTE